MNADLIYAEYVAWVRIHERRRALPDHPVLGAYHACLFSMYQALLFREKFPEQAIYWFSQESQALFIPGELLIARRLAKRACLEWVWGDKALAGECAGEAFCLDRVWMRLLPPTGGSMYGADNGQVRVQCVFGENKCDTPCEALSAG